MTSNSPPVLAGLCNYEEGARAGLAVDATVERLRRYVYLKSQLLFTVAAHFNGVSTWEVKGALSRHLWEDAEHSSWFRSRITEMRTPPHHLDRVPDPALETFVGELRHASNEIELLIGIYEVLRPALAAAFEQHLEQSHPIADQPTRRLVRFALIEEEEQIAWGSATLAALGRQHGRATDKTALELWRDHLNSYLEAAGGINGDSARRSIITLPPSRQLGAVFKTTRVPRRDARFPHVWQSRGVVPDAGRPVHERLWWMMNVRLNEMHVAELIATVIADWAEQPWEFYHDLARHLWDETRHCMLGEIAFASQGIDFTKIPTHTGFAEYPNTQLSPPDRYAFLWGIEQGLMVKSGKQAEVALAKAGGDERATVFQDFDWADEVLHAQIGRRWLERHYGDREKLNVIYQQVRPAYDQMKEEDLKKPGRDWWPAFYEKHLKQRDPNIGQSIADTPPATDGGY